MKDEKWKMNAGYPKRIDLGSLKRILIRNLQAWKLDFGDPSNLFLIENHEFSFSKSSHSSITVMQGVINFAFECILPQLNINMYLGYFKIQQLYERLQTFLKSLLKKSILYFLVGATANPSNYDDRKLSTDRVHFFESNFFRNPFFSE